MMKNKTIMTSLVVAIAITSMVFVLGLLQTQNTEAIPQGNNAYVFAEGVSPRVTFTFGSTEEMTDFQAFTQTAGTSGVNGRGTAPEFTLVKVPGNTPYLYRAADELFAKSNGGGGIDWQYNRFDSKVELLQAGQSVRTFVYTGCEITSYKVYTDYDKEEGYVTGGKTGFAVQDEFKLLCKGQKPMNLQLLNPNGNDYNQ